MKLCVAAASLLVLALLGGCASQPPGPRVAVLPAPGKPFELFMQDQAICEHYAGQEVRGEADIATERAIGSTALGTLLGAGLGAAAGRGPGAALGAAIGAVIGTGVGGNIAAGATMDAQQRYDMAYAQCMYARGNQVPVYLYPPLITPAPPPPPPLP
jgi:hypothetical protein